MFPWFMVLAYRKELLEEKAHREFSLDLLQEGIVIVDDKLQVEMVNRAASHLLGLPKRALVGKLFPGKEESLFLKKSRELLESCIRLQYPVTDFVLLEKGSKIHLDLMATVLGSCKKVVLLLQDRSSQYKVREMGKDFVASASHELKTPITIIRGFAETLQEMRDLPEEIEQSILEKIVRNCKRMETLIRNLLLLADIENIPLPSSQVCDVVELIEECKRITTTAHASAEILIQKTQDQVLARLDPSLMELAILNLLSNAAKYCKEAAHIEVSIGQKMEEIEIVIRDRGIGIPAQDLEHIFERFYTVDKAHSRKLGGAGLGLSLVKTILEKHDGTISVESTLGEGTAFTLTLPLLQGSGICK
jgi:signal transduction histidine kinase